MMLVTSQNTFSAWDHKESNLLTENKYHTVNIDLLLGETSMPTRSKDGYTSADPAKSLTNLLRSSPIIEYLK